MQFACKSKKNNQFPQNFHKKRRKELSSFPLFSKQKCTLLQTIKKRYFFTKIHIFLNVTTIRFFDKLNRKKRF